MMDALKFNIGERSPYLAVEGEMDRQGDLEFWLEVDDYSGASASTQEIYRFLNREQVTKLRDHLTAVLNQKRD